MVQPKKKTKIAWGELTGLGVGMLFMLSLIFGFEPQITRPPGSPDIRDMSFGEYWDRSLQQNGDSFVSKAITVIAFPGAWAGRLVHNIGSDS